MDFLNNILSNFFVIVLKNLIIIVYKWIRENPNEFLKYSALINGALMLLITIPFLFLAISIFHIKMIEGNSVFITFMMSMTLISFIPISLLFSKHYFKEYKKIYNF